MSRDGYDSLILPGRPWWCEPDLGLASAHRECGMDGFYRGIETSLLAFSLVLGLGALVLSHRALPRPTVAQLAVSLPMISVSALP